MDQARFGAGLFATGGNLLDQGYRGQTAALGPYEAYLRSASGLETLGQAPLDIGAQLGGRMANPTGAQALFQGGNAAAQSQFAANAYNPFATALTGLSQNTTLTNALANRFNRPAVSGFGAGGFGAGVNPYSGEFMGSTEF
jgi:hypothetical protein